jgi:hypothetical protein
MKKLFFQLAVLFCVAQVVAAEGAPTRTVYDSTLRNGFSIHHIRYEMMGNKTRLYTTNDSFIDVPTSDIVETIQSEEALLVVPEVKPKPDLNEVVRAASNKHQIDADLINAVIRAESAFNPRARSPKGAQGLMQLMPGTAAQLGVTDAYDPAANVDAGTRYLRDLLLQYNGDIVKALAAYNAGPRRVQQYNGVPPYSETRAYITRIVKEFNSKKIASSKRAPKQVTKKSPVSSLSSTPGNPVSGK